ncbi:MAG: hypothetical protein ACPGWR_12965 [Ardenticatenaceae bacterium]
MIDGTGVLVALSVGLIGRIICDGQNEVVGVALGVADGVAEGVTDDEAVDMTDKTVDITDEGTFVALSEFCQPILEGDRLQAISQHPITSREIEFKNTFFSHIMTMRSTFSSNNDHAR